MKVVLRVRPPDAPEGATGPIAVSIGLHVAGLGLALLWPFLPTFGQRSAPIIHRVSLVAGGPSVQAAAAPAPPAPPAPVPEATLPVAPKDPTPTPPKPRPKPKPKPKPTPPPAATPSGTEGGTGTGGTAPGAAGAGGTKRGAGSGIGVGGLDVEHFAYDWYLDSIIRNLSANWFKPRTVPGQKKRVVIAFRIQRDGTLTDIQIEEPSGYSLLDRSALRAVTLTRRLPPLPDGFYQDTLGVHFEFRL